MKCLEQMGAVPKLTDWIWMILSISIHSLPPLFCETEAVGSVWLVLLELTVVHLCSSNLGASGILHRC